MINYPFDKYLSKGLFFMSYCSDSLIMNKFKYYILLYFMLVTAGNLFSSDRLVDVLEITSMIDKNPEDILLEEFDSNSDGGIDHLVRTNIDGFKVMESIDFNHDGKMDDLYFYSNGIIVRREIDSNFDLKIDLWVYIKDGTFIEKYEQDLDFDGIIDKVKTFGGE